MSGSKASVLSGVCRDGRAQQSLMIEMCEVLVAAMMWIDAPRCRSISRWEGMLDEMEQIDGQAIILCNYTRLSTIVPLPTHQVSDTHGLGRSTQEEHDIISVSPGQTASIRSLECTPYKRGWMTMYNSVTQTQDEWVCGMHDTDADSNLW